MNKSVYLLFAILIAIGVKFIWFPSTSNNTENIDYKHDPHNKEVYGDLQYRIEHLLASDEDHVCPHDHDIKHIDKASSIIIEKQKENPKSFKLAKDLIHLNYFHKPGLAIKECERMLKHSPKDSFMLIHLAHLQAMRKDYKNAIVTASKVLKYEESDQANYIIGYCYFYLGNQQKAKEQLKKIPADSKVQHDVKPLLLKIQGS